MKKADLLKENPKWLQDMVGFVNNTDNLLYLGQRNKEGNNQNSQTESQAQIIPRPDLVGILPESVTLLEKLISRFPDIVEHARMEYAPQHVANYLITLAGAFNVYYATNKIIVENDPLTSYRLNLTQAFLITMTDGLWLLGIKVPKRM